jgi:hypothetical protein
MESRIEGAVLDLKNIFRTVFDRVRDGVPVRRAERQRLEHEDIERSLEHVPLDGRTAALWHLRKIIYGKGESKASGVGLRAWGRGQGHGAGSCPSR